MTEIEEVYKEIETIKGILISMGYTIGPVALEDDIPVYRINFTIYKKGKDGEPKSTN